MSQSSSSPQPINQSFNPWDSLHKGNYTYVYALYIVILLFIQVVHEPSAAKLLFSWNLLFKHEHQRCSKSTFTHHEQLVSLLWMSISEEKVSCGYLFIYLFLILPWLKCRVWEKKKKKKQRTCVGRRNFVSLSLELNNVNVFLWLFGGCGGLPQGAVL